MQDASQTIPLLLDRAVCPSCAISMASELPALKVALFTTPFRFIGPLPSTCLAEYGLSPFAPWLSSIG